MNKETKAKILKWILDNHEHHEEFDDDEYGCRCTDAKYPYVNSLELEKFINTL